MAGYHIKICRQMGPYGRVPHNRFRFVPNCDWSIIGEWSIIIIRYYTLSEAWSGVNWADLMAAQGAFGTDLYDRSTRTIVGTMLWTEYRPVIKIGPKGTLGSHEIRPIHSPPSLGQSIHIL